MFIQEWIGYGTTPAEDLCVIKIHHIWKEKKKYIDIDTLKHTSICSAIGASYYISQAARKPSAQKLVNQKRNIGDMKVYIIN